MVLFGVGRRFRIVSGTFSCRFEEIRHSIFWDSILIMIGFLVFEYEILYLVIFMDTRVFVVGIIIVMVMIIELLGKRFSY